MSDQRPIPPSDVSPEGPSHNRRIPPLAWVILALVIAVLAYGVVASMKSDSGDRAVATATPT
jgi:hypothetical protein